jgi:hypothetical protein
MEPRDPNTWWSLWLAVQVAGERIRFHKPIRRLFLSWRTGEFSQRISEIILRQLVRAFRADLKIHPNQAEPKVLFDLIVNP